MKYILDYVWFSRSLQVIGLISIVHQAYKMYKFFYPGRKLNLKMELNQTHFTKRDSVVLCYGGWVSYNKEMRGSWSPFALKLETYLRLANIPFKFDMKTTLMQSPTGKIPFIYHDSKIVCDTTLIIEYLKKTFPDNLLPLDLDDEHQKKRIMIKRVCEDSLYWVCVYLRWTHTEENFEDLMDHMLKKAPSFMKPFISAYLNNKMQDTMLAVGTGRYPFPRIMQRGIEDLNTLSDFLGNKKYMFGDEPTTTDCIVYGFASQVLYFLPKKDTPLREHLKKKTPNLHKYLLRIREEFFPESIEKDQLYHIKK